MKKNYKIAILLSVTSGIIFALFFAMLAVYSVPLAIGGLAWAMYDFSMIVAAEKEIKESPSLVEQEEKETKE